MAGGWEARWRFKEWTKKFNPAVDNPTVAVPKPKPKGKEGVKVGRGDEHLGRVRVGEELVPSMLKGWTFGSSDGRPRGKQGKESRKLGGREEGEPP